LTDATKETKGLLLLVASFALVFIIAACTTEVIKEVPVEVIKTVEVVKEVVVEKVVEVEVIKEVAVETEVVKTVEIIKEVAVEVVATPVPAASLVAPSGQKYGGTIKIGVVDFGTMDPALMGLSEGSNLYSELTYDNAIVTDFDGELMPWALESWSANADASQYTLKVRQGITFHRGGEQNAKDIKFTFDAPGNRELPTIVGELTVLPKHWWEGKDSEGRKRDIGATTLEKPLGSGPYAIKDFVAGRSVTLERVKNYWGEKAPTRVGQNNFDEMRFEFFRDTTVSLEAFKADQADWIIESSAKSQPSRQGDCDFVGILQLAQDLVPESGEIVNVGDRIGTNLIDEELHIGTSNESLARALKNDC